MELILVISIIGILSALAVPKTAAIIDDVRQKAVVERLLDDISFLRASAISGHDTTWLVLDTLNNKYGLYSGPTSGNRVLIPDSQTGASAMVDLTAEYETVSITGLNLGGGQEVFFNWWGRPSTGGTITLDNTRTITLEAETGLAYEAQ